MPSIFSKSWLAELRRRLTILVDCLRFPLLMGERVQEGLRERRLQMTAAIKSLVVPDLRARGFAGSFPSFHRVTQGCLELVHFQFSRYGGGVFVNIGSSRVNQDAAQVHQAVAREKLAAWNAQHQERLRPTGWFADQCFRYDRKRDQGLGGMLFVNIATHIVELLDSQAEPWWKRHRDSHE